MPKPTERSGRLRRDIAESMEEFDLQANNEKMIATQILPVHEAGEQAANVGRIPLEQLLRKKKTKRASGASYNRGKWEFTKFTYATEENGWEEPADERDTNIYGDFFEVELISAELARSTILLNQEERVADAVYDNSDVHQEAASAPWDDYASADPGADVLARRIAIWEATGIWPNAVVMSYLTFLHVRECHRIIDRINSAGAGDRTTPEDIGPQQLANIFSVSKVLIAGASTNDANQGQAADVAQIWDPTKCGVLRVAETRNVREPAFGRTFHWSADGSKIGTVAESYWEDQSRSEIQRARCETDERVIYPETAQVLTGVTS